MVYAPIIIITLLNVPIIITLLITIIVATLLHVDDKKRPTDAAAVAPSSDEEDTCWLCLDVKHESGQPLRRDCSCRGGSGFAHLPCVVEYAGKWSQQSHRHRADYMNKFIEPWLDCPNCCQHYRNQLALDLANELLSFVEKQYPDHEWKNREALRCKLFVLSSDWTQLERREEAKQVASKILSMIEKMKMENSSAAKKNVAIIELHTFSCLGLIALKEGTKEGAKTSMEYYEKCFHMSKAVGFTKRMASAGRSFAIAKCFYEGDSSLGAHLKARSRCRP